MTGSHKGVLRQGRMPERVLDALAFDGGWLTVPGLAMELKATEVHVRRVLYRLQSRGLVTRRFVVLREWRHSRGAIRPDSQAQRTEWKAG